MSDDFIPKMLEIFFGFPEGLRYPILDLVIHEARENRKPALSPEEWYKKVGGTVFFAKKTVLIHRQIDWRYMMQHLCEHLCRMFGQPEDRWPLVRTALLAAPIGGAGLLAFYCLLMWMA